MPKITIRYLDEANAVQVTDEEVSHDLDVTGYVDKSYKRGYFYADHPHDNDVVIYIPADRVLLVELSGARRYRRTTP